MTQPRSQLIDPTQSGTFHCVNRCVRQSCLCGLDKYLGKSFEHRKSWVEDRILELENIFACGVHAWAIMSNHLHIVVHMSPSTANDWSSEEVAAHWHHLHIRLGATTGQNYLRVDATGRNMQGQRRT